MEKDNIIEVGIDVQGRLYIKPQTKRFSMIYRLAVEVHWDEKGAFLYSPKPREWNYLKWYKHIIKTVEECNCLLHLTGDTSWVNIPDDLKNQISSANLS